MKKTFLKSIVCLMFIPGISLAATNVTSRIIFKTKNDTGYKTVDTKNDGDGEILRLATYKPELASVRTSTMLLKQQLADGFHSGAFHEYLLKCNFELTMFYDDTVNANIEYVPSKFSTEHAGSLLLKLSSSNCSSDQSIATYTIDKVVKTYTISGGKLGRSCYATMNDQKINDETCSMNFGDYMQKFLPTIESNFEFQGIQGAIYSDPKK